MVSGNGGGTDPQFSAFLNCLLPALAHTNVSLVYLYSVGIVSSLNHLLLIICISRARILMVVFCSKDCLGGKPIN